MNTNKIKSCLFILAFILTFLNINVFAEERACNFYATQGKQACNNASYQGYKCEWKDGAKGGERCKQSQKLAEDKKETITSCSQITDSETCNSSQVKGTECIWRQNACHTNALIDDGTDDTIIADDKEDREQAEATQPNQKVTIPKGSKDEIDNTPVLENVCGEESVQRILKLVGYIIIIIKVLVPLILIIIGSFDLFQAVVGKDEKALSKGIKSLMLRVVLGILIFFVPTFVNWAFDVFYEVRGQENNKQCVTCVLDPTNCNNGGNDNTAGNS